MEKRCLEKGFEHHRVTRSNDKNRRIPGGDQIMFQLLFGICFLIVLYAVYRLSQKQPLIPRKNQTKQVTNNIKAIRGKGTKGKETNADPTKIDIFKNFFNDIKEIDNHMIRHNDDTFVMVIEAIPVNYFLLSAEEQESIDVIFENWLASITYDVKIYLQNRFIDLSEPIENMHNYMISQDDLSANAREYGKSLIESLTRWQYSRPRYETKQYLILPYKVNAKAISAEDSEELEEKIIDKAFSELYRRYYAAKSSLRRANIELEMLSTEGIIETFYYAFNRRKALKNRFKDIREKEMLSMYVTADQDDARIQMVKESIENEEKEKTAGTNQSERVS